MGWILGESGALDFHLVAFEIAMSRVKDIAAKDVLIYLVSYLGR
jgi:hypothetical protein